MDFSSIVIIGKDHGIKNRIIGILTIVIGAVGVMLSAYITYSSFVPRAAPLPQAPALPALAVSVDPILRRQLESRVKAAPTERLVEALIFLERPKVAASVRSSDRVTRVSERASYVNDLQTKTSSIQQTVLQSMTSLVSAGHVSVKKTYYVDNVLLVSLDNEGLDGLTKLRSVRAVTPNYQIPVPKPSVTTQASQWNISMIKADTAWSELGIRGANTVVANIDTGVRWDHNAVKLAYRGWNSGAVSHDYNWFDPTGTYPSAPGDNNNHGTHTMGTMVGGNDPNYVIGVAPDAKWVAAKGCVSGWCMGSDLLSAAQWMLAPTKLDGSSPDPAQAPDVVNNSWGGGSCDTWFAGAINSWRNAGIVPVFSQGNSGPNPGSANSPGDNPQAIGVGATDSNDVIASFSSRGPSCAAFGSETKPEVSAPGVSVLSSIASSTTSYAYYSGTSMAAPHVAGTVALMRSANPSLSVDEAETILKVTSADKGAAGPDNDYGAGRINAYEVVNVTMNGGSITGTVTKQSDNTPIVGASVVIQKTNNLSFIRQVTTDNAGAFSFSYVSPDSYVINISAFGFTTFTQFFSLTPKQQFVLPVQLTSAPTYTLSGTITNAGSLPVAATVTLLNTPLPSVTSNPKTGAYTISGIPSDIYMLQVTSPGLQTWKNQVTVNSNTTKNVQLANLPAIPITNGFENGLSGWTGTGLWNVLSSPNYCSNPKTGTKSAYYGNPNACNYDVGITKGELTSPLFYIPNVTGPVSADFWSWYQTESSGTYWDKRLVEVKEESGNWTTLLQLSNDPMQVWQAFSVNLDSYKGKNVQVRFVFDSVDAVGNQYKGWYLDDVSIAVHGADLSLSQTAPAQATIGSTVEYKLSIANKGDKPAENTKLTDTWVTPGGASTATLVRVTDRSGRVLPATTNNTGSFTIDLGTLAPGATTSATIVFTIADTAKRTEKLTNTAELSTSSVDIDPTNNTSTAETVIISAELSLSGKDTVISASSGIVQYAFTLQNIGELPATNVNARVTIDAPFPWQLTTATPSASQKTLESNTGSFDLTFGTLTPSETATFTYTVKPISPANGSFDVTATASTDAKESSPDNTVHLVTPINTLPTPTPVPNTPPTIVTTTLPYASLRKAYNAKITARDVNGDTLTLATTGLPSGISQGPCTQSVNTGGSSQIDCVFQGTAKSRGVYSVNVTVSDGRGGVAKKTLRLIVLP